MTSTKNGFNIVSPSTFYNIDILSLLQVGLRHCVVRHICFRQLIVRHRNVVQSEIADQDFEVHFMYVQNTIVTKLRRFLFLCIKCRFYLHYSYLVNVVDE
jgi:hypothetical protein